MSHNHKIQRQEHRHDLEQIKIYLAQQGFQVVDLQQKWRHVTGQVVKDDTAHFFKLRSTEEIAKRYFALALKSAPITKPVTKLPSPSSFLSALESV